MQTFFPERLLAARTLLDRTQEEVAAAAHMEQPLISMIESHHRAFTQNHAVALADAMNLPLAFFSVRPRSIPFDSLLFRKNKTSSNRVAKRVRVHFQEGFRVVEDLLDGTGYPTPPLPTIQDDDDMLPISRIEEIADLVRTAFRLDPDAPVPNVTRVLERHGFVVAPMVLASSEMDPDAQQPGHFGVSYWAGRSFPGMIGYFPGSSADRDRFTLAHELGHAVLHSDRTSSDPEKEANLFAGAFLIPAARARPLLSGDVTLAQLARIKAEWGISIQALVMRGSQAGYFSADRGQTLYRQISSRGWRKKEPVEVIAEHPKLFYRLLANRYGDDPFRNREIEQSTALPMFVLRSLAPTPLTAPPVREGEPGGKLLQFAPRAQPRNRTRQSDNDSLIYGN